jgi:hypothetical protein
VVHEPDSIRDFAHEVHFVGDAVMASGTRLRRIADETGVDTTGFLE